MRIRIQFRNRIQGFDYRKFTARKIKIHYYYHKIAKISVFDLNFFFMNKVSLCFVVTKNPRVLFLIHQKAWRRIK
jgi:hypothetical protein